LLNYSIMLMVIFPHLLCSSSEKLAVEHSIHVHAPIFAVVMRSASSPKVLECHGFICKSTEDAIVIAATLYQSLMAKIK